MEKDMNRRGFLKYAAASALGMGALGVMTGCSSKETASSSAASTSGAVYTPGTYTASAEGYGSDVTVTVTFDETSITNVVVDSSGETENVGAAAAERGQKACPCPGDRRCGQHALNRSPSSRR